MQIKRGLTCPLVPLSLYPCLSASEASLNATYNCLVGKDCDTQAVARTHILLVHPDS